MPLLYTEHSLDFDGIDDFVNVGNVSELTFERTDAFSVSFWMKTSTNTLSVVLGKIEDVAPFRGWDVQVKGDGTLRWELVSTSASDQAVVDTTSLVTDGLWHHYVCTYSGDSDAGNMAVYRDGESLPLVIVSDTLSATIVSTADFNIAQRDPADLRWTGRISEVAVYDKSLTTSEVASVYSAGNPPNLLSVGPTANLEGYWRLGEHDYPTVPDLSSSGNDGTMTNMGVEDIVVDAPLPHQAYYCIELQESLSQYVTMGHVSEVAFADTDSFSVSLWVKTLSDRDPDGYLVSQIDDTVDNRGWGFIQTAGQLRAVLYNNGGSDGIDVQTTNLNALDGEWHHCVLTYDGSGLASGVSLYVDAVSGSINVLQDNLTGTIFENAAPLNLNSRQDGGSLSTGYYTEVSIWSKELSGSEVSALYNGGVPRDARTLGSTADLQGYWVVDRENYPTLVDFSLNANNGTAVSTSTVDINLDAPGIDFTNPSVDVLSVEFTGDGHIEVGDVPELDFETTDPFSLVCMAKISTTGQYNPLLTKEEGSGAFEGYMMGLLSSGAVFFRLEGNGGSNNKIELSSIPGSFKDEIWRLFVVTYDGGLAAAGVHIYVDGIEIPFTVARDTLSNSTLNSAPFQIGDRDSNNTPPTGFIGWAAVYSKELTEADVRRLYNGRSSSDLLEVFPAGNLVGYWRMGDGDTFPTITDHSASGNDGLLVGNFHQERLVDDRPPGTPLTQLANGLGGESSFEPGFGFGRNDSFSMSCWFKTDSGSGSYPKLMGQREVGGAYNQGWWMQIEGFGSWNPGGVAVFLGYDDLGDLELYVNTNSTYNSLSWHHAVMTYDGSATAAGITIYIDGVAVASTVRHDTLGANDFATAGPFAVESAGEIGSASESAVCQAAVYDKELSAGEVTAIYGAGTPPDLTSIGPTGNLVGYWPVTSTDANTGGIEDVSVGGNDLTSQDLSGAIQGEHPQPLVSSYSLDYDGNDDYVNIGNTADLAFERTDPFSLMAWIRPTIGVLGAILGKHEGSGDFSGWEISISATGTLIFELVNTGGGVDMIQVETDSAVTNEWNHVAVTYDGSSDATGARFYVNGLEVAVTVVTDTLSGSILTSVPVRIGGRGSGTLNPFNGLIDEVAIYDRALAPSEVLTLGGQVIPQDHAAVGPVDSLISWWRMGDIGPAVYPTIADMTITYDNDGTMTNMGPEDIVSLVSMALTSVYLDYIYGAYPIGESTGPAGDILILTYAAEVEISAYYKMRALADPGPGYVTWVVDTLPDYTGVFAPASIQGGSAIVSDRWDTEAFLYRGIQQDKTTSNTTGPVTVADPMGGLILLGVDTSDVAWLDLGLITLPATPQVGSEVVIKDIGGQADSKRIAVDGDGNDIDGQENRLLDSQYEAMHLVFGGVQWSVV